jgi:hypothetical protein
MAAAQIPPPLAAVASARSEPVAGEPGDHRLTQSSTPTSPVEGDGDPHIGRVAALHGVAIRP